MSGAGRQIMVVFCARPEPCFTYAEFNEDKFAELIALHPDVVSIARVPKYGRKRPVFRKVCLDVLVELINQGSRAMGPARFRSGRRMPSVADAIAPSNDRAIWMLTNFRPSEVDEIVDGLVRRLTIRSM
jgi:hypothetical protein